MGKSVAAEYLRGFGLPVVDTDVLARALVQPGEAALDEIREAFGPGVIGAGGVLRRDALAAKVFDDESQRRRLEQILHPRIRAAWVATVERWEAEGRPAGVVVIPLLFETDAQSAFAATICVACSGASQDERLAARGWSAEESARRIRAQWPIDKKLGAADFVVWAEGGIERTREQLVRILRRLGINPESDANRPIQ